MSKNRDAKRVQQEMKIPYAAALKAVRDDANIYDDTPWLYPGGAYYPLRRFAPDPLDIAFINDVWSFADRLHTFIDRVETDISTDLTDDDIAVGFRYGWGIGIEKDWATELHQRLGLVVGDVWAGFHPYRLVLPLIHEYDSRLVPFIGSPTTPNGPMDPTDLPKYAPGWEKPLGEYRSKA